MLILVLVLTAGLLVAVFLLVTDWRNAEKLEADNGRLKVERQVMRSALARIADLTSLAELNLELDSDPDLAELARKLGDDA